MGGVLLRREAWWKVGSDRKGYQGCSVSGSTWFQSVLSDAKRGKQRGYDGVLRCIWIVHSTPYRRVLGHDGRSTTKIVCSPGRSPDRRRSRRYWQGSG